MRYPIYVTIVLLLCAGCTERATEPDGLPIDARNFTLVLQCAGGGNLSMKVTGNAFVNKYEFGKSNCSMHVSSGIVRMQCPREPLRFSALAQEGKALAHRTSQE